MPKLELDDTRIVALKEVYNHLVAAGVVTADEGCYKAINSSEPVARQAFETALTWAKAYTTKNIKSYTKIQKLLTQIYTEEANEKAEEDAPEGP